MPTKPNEIEQARIHQDLEALCNSEHAPERPWLLSGFNDSGYWKVSNKEGSLFIIKPTFEAAGSDDKINAIPKLICDAVNEYALLRRVAEAAQQVANNSVSKYLNQLDEALSALAACRKGELWIRL